VSELVPTSGLAGEVAAYGPTRRIRVLVSAWLASFTSVHTQTAYARDIKMWLAFCDEHDIDPLTAIRAHLDAWRTIGAGYDKPSDTSLSRRLSAISSFYAYLVDEEVIEKSPAARIRRPKIDPYYSPTHGLTQDGMRAMIAAAGEFGPRELAVVGTLVLSGLRVSELVLADIDDLGHEDGFRTIDVTRKGGAKQRLSLSEAAATVLDAYIGDRSSGPLIVTKSGRRISVYQVQRIVRKVAIAAKVPHAEKISPHSLRHTFVTLSMDAGALLHDVQDAVGHRDPKTTVRYNRARNQLRRNPAHKLSEYLTEPKPQGAQ